MNLERLKLARDHLMTLPDHALDMRDWFSFRDEENSARPFASVQQLQQHDQVDTADWCGTAACLAGHVQLRFAETATEKKQFARVFAVDWLELEYLETKLFAEPALYVKANFPVSDSVHEQLLGEITREQVIAALDTLLVSEDARDALCAEDAEKFRQLVVEHHA